ncbi:hypothetical protein ACLB2K_054662 [Fragaria x ananassa]
MTVSRGVLLFCLVTLFISLCCIKVTEQAHIEGCGESDKDDQCREGPSDELEHDQDVDDTYKVVNKVAVTFTQRNAVNPNPETENSEATGTLDEQDPHVVVLGH